MPVILNQEQQYQTWLDQSDIVVLKNLLQPYAGDLEFYPVSAAVNYSKVDDPRLIEKIEVKRS